MTMNEIKEYKGTPITFENKDGKVMVNATEMAKPFGRQPNDWLKTEQAQRMIKAITETKKIGSVENQLVVTVKGGNDLSKQGTWMHEDVALVFAQWLSPEFYLWCNDRIKELLSNGVATINNDDETILNAITILQKRIEESKARQKALEQKIAIDKPKVEYFDKLVDRQLLTNFRDTAKEFGIKPTDFINSLLEKGYIYRDKKGNIKPYAQHTPELFEIKDYKSIDGKHVGSQTLITPKGKATFNLLIKPEINPF